MHPVPFVIEPDAGRVQARGAAQPMRAEKQSKLPTRTTVNFLLDLLLLIVFVLLMGVTAVCRFVFPPVLSAGGWQLWGGTLDSWLGLQFGLVATLTLLIVVHVMLHWTWVCGVIANRLSQWRGSVVRFDDGYRTLLGVGLLIVVLNIVGLLVALATLMIQQPVLG